MEFQISGNPLFMAHLLHVQSRQQLKMRKNVSNTNISFLFFCARSPGSGLYDNLQKYNLPYAEAIFEINYFHHNPKPFFALAKELHPGNYRPNLTHYFVRLLHDKGQLLRMYTQNIDGLERSESYKSPAPKLLAPFMNKCNGTEL